jgi:uncharacterized protein
MLLEMQVTGLTIDPANNAPIVILREKEGARVLPIWIGVIEASAIAFELEQVKLTRPMTHDLLRAAIEALGGRVERVAILDLKENTYFAVIVVNRGDQTVELDARPSDAIALGLRAKAPILCESRVLEEAHVRQAKAAAEPVAASAAGADGAAAAPAEGEEAEDERGDDGPKPIVVTNDPKSWLEVLENLDPKDFGKYKM